MSEGGDWAGGVVARRDLLDRPERLRGAFWSSLALHIGIVSSIVGLTWVQNHQPHNIFGDVNGGGIGSVTVNPVARIPLPTQRGPENPVANDTESQVPEAPSKVKPQPKVKESDLEAIPLPSRNAQQRPSQAASAPNKFRDQQPQAPNQLYSQTGGRMADPMYGMAGGGGVHIGTSTPFGTQFGWYADQIKNKVGNNWHHPFINARVKPTVSVIFTIQRDGSVPYSSVRVTQSSGIPELDNAAKRAVLDSAPFAQLPVGLSRNSVDVEFTFDLN